MTGTGRWQQRGFAMAPLVIALASACTDAHPLPGLAAASSWREPTHSFDTKDVRGWARSGSLHDLASEVDGRVIGRNPAAGLDFIVAPPVVEVTSREAGWSVGLHLSGYGRKDQLIKPADAGRVAVDGSRATFRRGQELEEWYINRPRGLEQGMTLHAPPSGDGPVVLAVAFDGAQPVGVDNEPGVMLVDSVGRQLARYAKLAAYDADGRALSAWMQPVGHEVHLFVDDSGARYPVEVDPLLWIEHHKIAGIGFSVSASGNTVIVGTPNLLGAGVAFVRGGGTWTQQQLLQVAAGTQSEDSGWSVSLDGDTAIIGAPNAFEGQNQIPSGAAYVLVRSNGVWSEQQRVVPDDPDFSQRFGTSVALVGDTAIVGAPMDNQLSGAAYVFTRSGVVWTQQQKLIASDGAPNDQFGESTSFDGVTAVVGASANPPRGAAYVYTRSGTVWTQRQKLTVSDSVSLFGSSVSVSGGLLLVGDPSQGEPTTAAGAAYAFSLSGDQWVHDQKLVGRGVSHEAYGASVSVHGDTAVVSAPGAPSPVEGNVHVLRRQASVWTEQQRLLPPDPMIGDRFGGAVSLSADTLAVGTQLPDATPMSTYLWALVGGACTSTGMCASGFCVDGFCCDNACDGLCQACDLPDAEGTCAVVPKGEDPHDDCAAGVCLGADQCVLDDGQPCTAGPECNSGFCVHGVCCDSACDGGCGRCDSAGNEGVCTPVPEGNSGGSECALACDGVSIDCPASCTNDALCPPGTTCDLDSGTCGNAASCDGDHTLNWPDGATKVCAPYRCTGADICLAICNSSADCVDGFRCASSGQCIDAAGGTTGGCTISARPTGDMSVFLLGLVLAAVRRRPGSGVVSVRRASMP